MWGPRTIQTDSREIKGRANRSSSASPPRRGQSSYGGTSNNTTPIRGLTTIITLIVITTTIGTIKVKYKGIAFLQVNAGNKQVQPRNTCRRRSQCHAQLQLTDLMP